MTVSTISTELMIFLQPKLMGWCVFISWNVLCINWIIVLKVKVRVKVENFIEFLSILYFLYHWSLGSQTSCVYVLLLIIKPSTTKWTYMVTYSTTRHTKGWGWGYFATQGSCFLLLLLFVCFPLHSILIFLSAPTPFLWCCINHTLKLIQNDSTQ